MSERVTVYQVLQSDIPADSQHFRVDSSWNSSVFMTLEEAVAYALNWANPTLGAKGAKEEARKLVKAGKAIINSPTESYSICHYPIRMEIRKVLIAESEVLKKYPGNSESPELIPPNLIMMVLRDWQDPRDPLTVEKLCLWPLSIRDIINILKCRPCERYDRYMRYVRKCYPHLRNRIDDHFCKLVRHAVEFPASDWIFYTPEDASSAYPSSYD